MARDLSVLIVDDSRTMRRVLTQYLNHGGITRVMAASGGTKALAVLADGIPDLMILDLNMPGMHGLELLEKVKSDPAMAHIPVIILTVEASQKTMNEALSQGAASYIVKPVSREAFLEQVDRVMANRSPCPKG